MVSSPLWWSLLLEGSGLLPAPFYLQAVVSSQTLGGQLAGDTGGQKDLWSISDMGTLSPTVVMRTQILTPPGEATSKVPGLSEPQCLLL